LAPHDEAFVIVCSVLFLRAASSPVEGPPVSGQEAVFAVAGVACAASLVEEGIGLFVEGEGSPRLGQ
jgi:hypothetical protein